MSEIACRAGLCYNQRRILLCLENAGTLSRLANLCRRLAMDMIPQDTMPRKRCTGPCGRILPATTDYFPVRKTSKNGLYPQCNQCKRERSKVYRSEHPEIGQAYYKENLDSITEYKKSYRETHQEQRKLYDVEHKAEIDEQRRLYIEENRARISETHRRYCDQYYQTERGRIQMRVSSGNRRARKRNAQGTHTTDELYQQLHRQKSTCYYCHIKLAEQRNSWVAEHVIPLSRGGSNSIDNIVIACPLCNLRKHDKLPHEWIEGGRLL